MQGQDFRSAGSDPDILADIHSKTHEAQVEYKGSVTGREIALFIKNAVIREHEFIDRGDKLIFMDDRSRVVLTSIEIRITDHHDGLYLFLDQLFQCPGDILIESLLQEQILGGISAQGKFGERHQIASIFLGCPGIGYYLLQVLIKGSYSGVDLGQSYAELLFHKLKR